MWTMPLDPRLITMISLSEEKQNDAKSSLIKEVTEVVQVIDQKEREQNRNTNSGFAER